MIWARRLSSSRNAPDGPRGGEPLGDDPAQPVVVFAVHVEHDDLLQVDVLTRHLVRELRNRGVGRAEEDVVAARDLFDVLVLGDDPVAAVVETALADSLFTPPNRRDLAQLGELLDRQPLDTEVGIQEVEAGRDVGGLACSCAPQYDVF